MGPIGVEGSIDLNQGCRHGDDLFYGTLRTCFVAVGVGLGIVGRL